MPLDESFEQARDLYDLIVDVESHAERYGLSHPNTLAAANKLAIAFRDCGEVAQAIGLLTQVLDQSDSSPDLDDPIRADLLSTLGEILFEQGHLEQAALVRRQVLESRVRHSGADDPASLDAKADLATLLFALGEDEEANALEQKAFESARLHLEKTHPVACLLAWNRAAYYDCCGDPDSSRRILITELVWLLAEDPSRLGKAENRIRSLVSKRLNWDVPTLYQ
jgi:tetratricopeptide (TPR) repeat protein